MKHKNLMARLTAGTLALVLAAGIGITPAMAADGDSRHRRPPIMEPVGESPLIPPGSDSIPPPTPSR